MNRKKSGKIKNLEKQALQKFLIALESAPPCLEGLFEIEPVNLGTIIIKFDPPPSMPPRRKSCRGEFNFNYYHIMIRNVFRKIEFDTSLCEHYTIYVKESQYTPFMGSTQIKGAYLKDIEGLVEGIKKNYPRKGGYASFVSDFFRQIEELRPDLQSVFTSGEYLSFKENLKQEFMNFCPPRKKRKKNSYLPF